MTPIYDVCAFENPKRTERSLNLKKFFATFIILVLGVAVFASCGGGSNDEGTKPADEGQNIEQTENQTGSQNNEQTPAATFANYAETDSLKIGIAEGWEGKAEKESGVISVRKGDGRAMTVVNFKTGDLVKIEDVVNQTKESLASMGAVEEAKATYAGIDYTTLTYSIAGSKVASLIGLKNGQIITIALNGDIDAEVEGMLNSIEVK